MASTMEIFCCYAREDIRLLQALKKQLKPLVYLGTITLWADTDIGAGAEWEREIEKHLSTAQIILLLVSPDFIASEYAYSKEMTRAIERYDRGEAQVIPIILRPVDWMSTPIVKLKVLPNDGKPITKWRNRDEAFQVVAQDIKKAIEAIDTQNQRIEKQTSIQDDSRRDVRSYNETSGLPAGASPLPQPTHNPPYHLSLDEVLSPPQMESIRLSGRLVFHVVGNTGGVKSPLAQEIVAMHMQADYDVPDIEARPSFFYHLGDIVYYYGQASEYYSQFYQPYSLYPAPIFAIPGNHDGATSNESELSLAAFIKNFCAPTSRRTQEAEDTSRLAMKQPNAYWTLETPFVTIIGLYTNVREGGWLDNKQIAWLASELRNAPTDKALILAMHHTIFSVDVFQGGSQYMKQVIEKAILETGRVPDAVFASQVNNYQRFTCTILGHEVPFIVAGAGGYWNLRAMARGPKGLPLVAPYAIPEMNVTLESFCADRHGYLKVEVTAQTLKGEYFAVPSPNKFSKNPVELMDSFFCKFNKNKINR